MKLFNDIVHDVRRLIDSPQTTDIIRNLSRPAKPWPEARKAGLVLKPDCGLELGAPGHDSVSFLVWTDDISLIKDDAISIIGPDIPEVRDPVLPFGRAALVGVEGFTEDNTWDRFREMESMRYQVKIDGYMIRAMSHSGQEWCRISRTAISRGITFAAIGFAFMSHLQRLAYVRSVEMLYITQHGAALTALRTMGSRALETVQAIRKLSEDSLHECGTCDSSRVCQDTDELIAMRKKILASPEQSGADRQDGAA